MKYLFYIVLLSSFVSCHRTYYSVHVSPRGVEEGLEDYIHFIGVRDTAIEVNVAYVGDAFHYIIFETHIINHSKTNLSLSHSDFVIALYADDRHVLPRTLYALDPHQEEESQEDIKNAIEQGLNLQGDESAYAYLERGLEEEMLYLQTGVLDQYILVPGDTLITDLLFDRYEYPGQIYLKANLGNRVYSFEFDQIIEEYRQ